MNSAFIALPVVASIGLILWAALFFGGRLVRRSLNYSTSPSARNARSRFFRDVEPLEDLLVDFVAQTPEFAGVLRLLARHDKPLSFAQIVHELRIGRNGSSRVDTVASLTGVALIILHLAGLVRLQRRGFVATDIGREIWRRTLRGTPRTLRASTLETKAKTVSNRSNVSLSVGKRAADNHGISWRSSLRGVTSRRNKPPITNIGALRKRSVPTLTPTNLVQRKTTISTEKTNTMNNENDIIVTAPDHAELSSVITFTGKVSERAKWELRLLENELRRARIVTPEEIPSDVITMNTRAELLDLESGERMEFTLVLPADVNINDGKVSVLTPLGTAMLGYRVGDQFEWHVPYGARKLKVTHVYFQPEAELKKAA
jgi:regulator of nucleoside diphosphate kinase